MPRVMIVYGTRPEAVKLAPVVRALRDGGRHEVTVAVTAQHRMMLDQVNDMFGITPDHDLDIMRPRQSLTEITTNALTGISALLEREQPDAVVVQGDTTTTFATALAGFYARIPVVHVEAGLRTGERFSPFPEELNRRLTTALTTVHLAPTERSRANLLAEGVDPAAVIVTGNTVVDAIDQVIAAHGAAFDGDAELAPVLAVLDDDRPLVLVTAHRRESWGAALAGVGRALAAVARAEPGVLLVLPVHANPAVRDVLLPPLQGLDNIVVVEPLSYLPFVRLLARSRLAVTDSGGVQEEAPGLGVPVVVIRDTTERSEAIDAGTACLVGTDEHRVAEVVLHLLRDDAAHRAMSSVGNPFGDGRAAQRTAAAIDHLLLGTPRPDEFRP